MDMTKIFMGLFLHLLFVFMMWCLISTGEIKHLLT
jgi:hypothetical protein